MNSAKKSFLLKKELITTETFVDRIVNFSFLQGIGKIISLRWERYVWCKIQVLCLLLMLVTLCVSPKAEASLVNRGTDTLGNRLIYDDDRDITWYDFSNPKDIWDNQVAWADALVVDFGGTIIDDWRLPTAFNEDGSGPTGPFFADSEMGHLYYDDDALNIDGGGSLNNPTNFQDLNSFVYWSGTEFATDPDGAWVYDFSFSGQNALGKGLSFFALAVRPGDVAAGQPIPEPGTIMLMGLGVAGMALYGARRRRQLR